MKQSYLELQSLWLEFDSAERMSETAGQKADFADKAGEKYVEILSQTENHTLEDYESSTNQFRKDVSNSLAKYLACRFCVYVLPVVVGLLVLVFLPE